MARQAFIMGGTGQIGRAVGSRLSQEGWHVTFASRGGEIPEGITGPGLKGASFDRDQPGAIAQAIGSGADAVIDTVAYNERHAEQLLEIQTVVNHFVVISSSSVYRDDAGRTLDEARENGFPHFRERITEEQPTVEPGGKTYSTRKVALERRLFQHSRSPVAVLRPGAIYGTHSTHPREWWFVKRMLDDRRTIPLRFDGQSRFHATAAANIAEAAVRALARPVDLVLNVADPTAPTVSEIGGHIADAMAWSGTFVRIGPDECAENPSVGGTPWSIPAPFILDTSAAEAIGYKAVTDHAHSAAEICAWLRSSSDDDWQERFPVLASYPIPLFDYEAEDAALRRSG